MASAGSAPFTSNFVLTPQQQNLLFAALNSNNPAAQSPENGALSLSPSSLTQSPQQDAGLNSLDESPFIDPDYDLGLDSSFDFGIAANSQQKMIGDLPGTSQPESPENEQHEKRSHPGDDEAEGGGTKRRESGEKIPKKPGRKPLTSEPSSKRKAQNRAAQRAFRERKEKHVKDLENKVEELQKASEAANHQNSLLHAQIEQMTNELSEYKRRVSVLTSRNRSLSQHGMPSFGNAAVSNLADVNFHFEFPKFGSLPGPPLSPPSASGVKQAQASPSLASQFDPKDTAQSTAPYATKDTPSPIGTLNGAGNSGRQSSDDLSKGSGSSASSDAKTNNNISSSVDLGNFSFPATTTSSPSASSNSNVGMTSSCGTSPEPFTQSPMGFKPLDTMKTIGEEGATLPANQNAGTFGSFDLNGFDWLASQNGGQFDPQLFGSYREPQENILSGAMDDAFFSDAFDMDFTTPYYLPPTQAVAPQKKDIIAEIDQRNMTDDDGALLPCNKLREKLQNCPKVQSGDYDVDALCDELKKKAKCSVNRAMMDEDFAAFMTQFFNGKCTSEEASSSKTAETSTTAKPSPATASPGKM